MKKTETGAYGTVTTETLEDGRMEVTAILNPGYVFLFTDTKMLERMEESKFFTRALQEANERDKEKYHREHSTF